MNVLAIAPGHWHARSTAEIAARYPGARVWAFEPAREVISERTLVEVALAAARRASGR